MPFVHRHLAAHQRRAIAAMVVQQFEHVAPLHSGKRCQALREAAVAVGQAQFLHQARQAL
jgi:hypothetical protein